MDIQFIGECLHIFIHASIEDALVRSRNNAVNVAKQWPNSEVEIVLNGAAVKAALAEAHATDACLRLCQNTIDRLSLEVPDGVKTVPSAIVWLVERQKQGWAYISA